MYAAYTYRVHQTQYHCVDAKFPFKLMIVKTTINTPNHSQCVIVTVHVQAYYAEHLLVRDERKYRYRTGLTILLVIGSGIGTDKDVAEFSVPV